jgi:hypothetical protein
MFKYGGSIFVGTYVDVKALAGKYRTSEEVRIYGNSGKGFVGLHRNLFWHFLL